MRASTLLLWVALCAATSAGQNDRRAAVPVTLSPTSVKSLSMPGFGWEGSARCDNSGNLYFHAVQRLNDSLILRLSPDGTYSLYSLSREDAAQTWYIGFRVSPDGKLSLLAHGNEEGIFLFQFGRDGMVSPTRVRLDTPENLDAKNFAVLPSGRIVLQGYYDESAPKQLRGRSYRGLFDASGTLIRASEGKERSEDALKDTVAQAVDAPAAQTEDGLLYLLTGNEITVMSPAGEPTRKFPVRLADPSYTAFNIYAVGRTLAVAYFKHAQAGASLTARYALFDVVSGNELGLYEPDKELGNNMVCYSNEGFEFFWVRRGRVQLMTAKP